MIRAVLTLSFMFCVAIVTGVRAQPYPTGPFSNELNYYLTRMEKTTTLKYSETVGLIDAVELEVVDEVSNNCWTNVSAVKSRVRAELERSNIAVYEEPLYSYTAQTPKIRIEGLGLKSGQSCVGHVEINISGYNNGELGSLTGTDHVFRIPGVHMYWRKSVILTSGRNLDDMILRNVQEWIDDLIGDRAAASRSEAVKTFRAKWSKSKIITERDYQESLKD